MTTARARYSSPEFLEVPPRFELGNDGFADRCLYHLAMAPSAEASSTIRRALEPVSGVGQGWMIVKVRAPARAFSWWLVNVEPDFVAETVAGPAGTLMR